MRPHFLLQDTTSGAICDRAPCLVIALGTFDGVHLAHAAIMKKAVSLAKELGAEPVVWMFDTHPQAYLSGKAQKLLTSPDERVAIAASLGVRYAIRASFADFCAIGHLDFLDFLKEDLSCLGAVCGFNYTFGRGGLGKAEDVFAAFGAHAHVLPPYESEGEVVSSSAIREMLTHGKIEKANDFLGRPYFICGKVISGEQIGRTLELPTANIALPKDRAVPASGVYFSVCEAEGVIRPAITNIGVRPTVADNADALIETHLLGFSGDLYGKEIRISFLERIRDERRFSSLGELKDAILKDKEYALSAWERKGLGSNNI